MEIRKRLRWLAGYIDPAYLILVLAVAALGWTNLSMRQERSALTRRLQDTVTGLTGQAQIQQGDVLPSFTGLTASGKPVSVDHARARRSLLLVYDPRCGVCKSEVPLWKALTSEASTLGVSVQWISVAPADLTQKGIARDALDVDPVIMPDFGMQRAYRVASVPQVLVVSQDGRVAWGTHGALSPEKQDELREVLKGHPGAGQ